MCQSIGPFMYCMLFVCVCVISNQSASKNHVICVKRTTHLITCCIKGTKISRLSKCTSVISLSKITHQMWYDHTFTERSKATKIVEMGE